MIPLPEEYIELPRVEETSLRHEFIVSHDSGDTTVLVEVGYASEHSGGKHICPYRFTLQGAGDEFFAKVAWGNTGDQAFRRAKQLAASELEVYRSGMCGVLDRQEPDLEPDALLCSTLATFGSCAADAFRGVRELADGGVPWAEYTLATYFFYPNAALAGVVHDHKLMNYWLRRAALNYVGLAYQELSTHYHLGWFNVPKDPEVANEYRRRARLYGFVFCQPE